MRPAKLPTKRRSEITAAAEYAAAESQPERGKQRAADFLFLAGFGFADRRGPACDVGPLAQGELESVPAAVSSTGTRVSGTSGPADRLEPHRRVKVEAVGEPGRGDRDVFLGFLNQGDPPFPLRQGTVGVGFSAFAGVGVVFGELIHFMKLSSPKGAASRGWIGCPASSRWSRATSSRMSYEVAWAPKRAPASRCRAAKRLEPGVG